MLQFHNLSKHYPGVLALDNVSLTLEAGRTHALVGENGAGKTTLIKILAGVIQADSGSIYLNDSPIHIANPQIAQQLGISVVHQHSHLIPHLSIAENDALRRGYPRGKIKQIAWSDLRRRTENALADLAPDLDPTSLAESLTSVQKQRVELALTLCTTPNILILDEPTAILPSTETDHLFERIHTFAQKGGTVLFISHRLNEVFRIAHTVTVLRDGQHIWTKAIGETNPNDLVQAMVGRSVNFDRNTHTPPNNAPILTVSNLTDTQKTIQNISFNIHPGEIYGLYGLVGAGQPELCQALFGLRPATGTIHLNNHNLTSASPETRVQSGMAYVPADRLTQGMFPAMTVGENLHLTHTQSLITPIDCTTEHKTTQTSIHTLDIRTTGPKQTASELSGGNQQKVLLGRWLQTNPSVLILEEPTQGVDVGAKSEIYNHILTLSQKGIAILLISSEIPELLTLSHRIGILCEGALVDEAPTPQTTEETLLHLALPNNQTPDNKQQTTEAIPAEHQNHRPLRTSHFALRTLFQRRETTLLLFILLFSCFTTLLSPAFATYDNLRDILVNNSILLIGALGISCVIIAGSIDISIGSALGLSAVIAGLIDQSGQSIWFIAPCALLTGLLLGISNGLLSAWGGIHAIVITLGTMSLYRGAIIHFTGGRWLLNLSDHLTALGSIPILLAAAFFATLCTYLFLCHTRSGRCLYAIGSHAEHATYLGIYPKTILPIAFALCGLLVGLAGLLLAARYGQVQTNAGTGFELKAIAAAVIGGVHIMGGRGTVLGIVLGTLLMGLVANVLVLLHISAFWEGVFVGLIILSTIMLDTRRNV